MTAEVFGGGDDEFPRSCSARQKVRMLEFDSRTTVFIVQVR